MTEHRLYRSESDRVLGGVCGGIAEVYDVDPTLVRLITLLIVLGTGAGLLVYLIAWLIMPTESEVEGTQEMTEFKRTCQECGKTWHVTQEEIDKLEKEKKQNSVAGAATAASGNLAASAQANRNKDAKEERIQNLNKCPDCGSRNYEEEKKVIEK